MSLFSSMNLARWILVIGGVGSVALAANGWRLASERAELERALAAGGTVEKTSQNIQYLGKQASKLEADAHREGLAGGQTEPSTYFRDLAVDEKVRLGSVDIKTQTPQVIYKGTQDLQYTIKPQSDRGAARDKLMNYMYLLEQRSRRVKVTHVQMSPEQKLGPGDVGNDLWKWNLEVTSRTKDEKAK